MNRFFYMIAAYNEEALLFPLCRKLEEITQRFPGSQILLLDNGSTDRTWQMMQDLSLRHPGRIHALHSDEKGMGVAFRMGLEKLKNESLTNQDWVVFAAADLPFAFTDLEGLLAVSQSERSETVAFVGSKSHPRSIAPRDWRRRLGSAVFSILRRAFLGLKTQDTQGSIFLRGDLAAQFADFKANDFFYAIEIIDRAEQMGRVTEIPIQVSPEKRPSKVRLVRDGMKMFLQLVRYRRYRPKM